MIAPARRAALDALLQIATGRVDPGAAMEEVRRSLSDERDRALMLELVMGTERMRAAVDWQLASRVTRPLARLDQAVLTILRMSGYQLLYLSRQPPSAVINDAVELTRRAGKTSAAGLVNAVLRALARDREALVWPGKPAGADSPADRERLVAHLATVHSHPEWLVARWVERYGADAAERWLVFNNHAAPLCVVPNRARVSRDALAEELKADGVETAPTGLAPHGLHVTSGNPLGTRAFREGRCLVQDEASQLITGLVGATPGVRVLDVCASPGGKTVALAADVGAGGRVVACDVRPHRLRVLADTLRRCRVPNVRIVQIPARGPLPFLDTSFDAVLVDAPCSGLGTLRRDPDIRWRRSAGNLPQLAETQIDLLARTAGFVRPGGTLIYSTCSSEPEENRDVVSAFLQAHPDFSLERVHETLPFRDDLDAFVGAVLRRATSNPRVEPVG